MMINIYTDGSCKSNGYDGYGGWAYVIINKGRVAKKDSGSVAPTTNNRMEIYAVIKALESLKRDFINYENAHVVIHSDSAYVVNAWNRKWITNWRLSNWKKSDGNKVENSDLWEDLLFYTKNLNVRFEKVKGHGGNKYNEMCDKMAQEKAQNLKDEWEGWY